METNDNTRQHNNESKALSETSISYLEPSDTKIAATNIGMDQNNLQIKQITSTSSLPPGYNCVDGTYETPIIISETNPLMNDETHPVVQTTSTFYIIRKIWVWIGVVFITFVVCLSIFPSVIALVDSSEKGNVSTIIFSCNIGSVRFFV